MKELVLLILDQATQFEIGLLNKPDDLLKPNQKYKNRKIGYFDMPNGTTVKVYIDADNDEYEVRQVIEGNPYTPLITYREYNMLEAMLRSQKEYREQINQLEIAQAEIIKSIENEYYIQ